jgi:hypothetical protein
MRHLKEHLKCVRCGHYHNRAFVDKHGVCDACKERNLRTKANYHPLYLAQLPDFIAAGYKPSEAEQRALSRLNE